MKRTHAPSPQVVRVLQAFAAQPSRWRYGYDLGTEVSLKSGSLYPILVRLSDRTLLEAAWEPGAEGKPPRHLYRLTAAGLDLVAQLATEPAARRSSLPRRQLREA